MLITIGAFDGFHRGHEKLLDICRANSEPDSNNWAVLSFWPHPGEFMKRLNHSLFTLSEREFIRRVLNIPNMFNLRFDDDLRNLPPEKFWSLIHSRFNITGLVMGSDFHFGLDRRGSAESLKQLAESSGVNNIHIANLLDKGVYSSSNARQKIFTGDVKGARGILGYNFFIMSSIIHGSHRGSKMNLPTANLNLVNNKIIPPYGVYASAVLINHEWHCGALSIGNNPTFGDINETRAEVHILDFDSNNNIYGENMLLFFLDRIRDIKTFDNKGSLINQIEQDINTCMKIYREADINSQEFFRRAQEVYYSRKNFLPEIINITHGEDIN